MAQDGPGLTPPVSLPKAWVEMVVTGLGRCREASRPPRVLVCDTMWELVRTEPLRVLMLHRKLGVTENRGQCGHCHVPPMPYCSWGSCLEA